MKKVLFFINHYSSVFGPRFFRWSAMIKQLQPQGYDFLIVDSEGQTVQPRPVPATSVNTNSVRTSRLKSFCKIFSFPDKSIRHLPRYLTIGQHLIKTHRPDCIIATGLPVTPLLAGAILKKLHPEITLVTEYGDPYYFNSNYRNSPRLLKFLDAPLDRFIMRQADKISVHTESFQKKLIEWAIPAQKIVLTRQFFDMEIDSQPIDFFQKTTINLVYAGAFYKNIRNPQPFLDAFQALPNPSLRFFIAGNLDDCHDLVSRYVMLDRRIIYLGQMDRSKVLNLLHQADFVVNFCNKGDLQLPSKLQELMILNPNIINLYEHENQRLERQAIQNIPHTVEAVMQSLKNLTKPTATDNLMNPAWSQYQKFVTEQTRLMQTVIQTHSINQYHGGSQAS